MTLHKTSRLRRDWQILALVAALLALGEFCVSSQFHRSIIILSMIHSVAALGLTLLVGYAGQVSLGHGAFVGIGAYTVAFCLQRLGSPVVFALAAAVVLPGILGFLIARPILRLSGHNLALGTLALGAVFYVVAAQARDVTGGLDPGIVDMPSMAFAGLAHERVVFWLSILALCLAAAVAANIVDGRFGRGLMILRSSELVAECMGMNTAQAKSMIFAVSASLAGLSGGLLALYLRSFNASAFGVGLSIELLMMVIVGSLSTIWGAIFGSFAIMVLPNLLEGFDQAKQLVYGVAMILIMLFAPNGLGETLFRVFTFRRKSV